MTKKIRSIRSFWILQKLSKVSTPANNILRTSHQPVRCNNKTNNPPTHAILTFAFCHHVPVILSHKLQYTKWPGPCFSLYQNSYSNSPFCMSNLVVIWTESTSKGIDHNNRIVTGNREWRGK